MRDFMQTKQNITVTVLQKWHTEAPGRVVISPYRRHDHIFTHATTNIDLRGHVSTRYIL